MSNVKTVELKSPKVGAILASRTSTQQGRAYFASTLVNEAKERSKQNSISKIENKMEWKIFTESVIQIV